MHWLGLQPARDVDAVFELYCDMNFRVRIACCWLGFVDCEIRRPAITMNKQLRNCIGVLTQSGLKPQLRLTGRN